METKKEKTYRVSRDKYLQLKRDEKAKREMKRLVLELFDKVKNWK